MGSYSVLLSNTSDLSLRLCKLWLMLVFYYEHLLVLPLISSLEKKFSLRDGRGKKLIISISGGETHKKPVKEIAEERFFF